MPAKALKVEKNNINLEIMRLHCCFANISLWKELLLTMALIKKKVVEQHLRKYHYHISNFHIYSLFLNNESYYSVIIINTNEINFLQLVLLKSFLMDQVDSFPVQIFPPTSLNTADVSGISQFPVGTSLKSPSITLTWAAGVVKPTLPSQMLLLMMAGSHSSCMVRLFLLQCTLWGIPFKWYSHLSPISIQDLTHLTWPSLMSQVCPWYHNFLLSSS